MLDKLNCKVFSTICQEDDEQEWLKTRTKGIGGSDIGAICGVSNYSSPRLVYLQKTGQYEDPISQNDEAKERMRWGHLLEPIVADEYAHQTGRRVISSPATLVHKDYPWALANVDRFILDEEGNPYGILECKTAGEFMNSDWEEGDIPTQYIYQLNWYLFVCDLKFGAFACLVGGNKFHYFEIYRNDELIEDMFNKAYKFWNFNVKKLIEPELTGIDADKEYVDTENQEVQKNSETVLEDETADELAETVKKCKEEIKRLEKIEKEAANKLKDKLKNTEIGYTKNYIIKWSPRTQKRVDSDKLKTKFPEVYQQCQKEVSFRAFSVKGV